MEYKISENQCSRLVSIKKMIDRSIDIPTAEAQAANLKISKVLTDDDNFLAGRIIDEWYRGKQSPTSLADWLNTTFPNPRV